jgi:hypothetical protein
MDGVFYLEMQWRDWLIPLEVYYGDVFELNFRNGSLELERFASFSFCYAHMLLSCSFQQHDATDIRCTPDHVEASPIFWIDPRQRKFNLISGESKVSKLVKHFCKFFLFLYLNSILKE